MSNRQNVNKVVVISAIPQELEYLQNYFSQLSLPIHFAVVGIGPINTALNLVNALQHHKNTSLVCMVGCCGSYNNIPNGEVIIANEEINGDLGIITSNGWIEPKHFGFPIVKTPKAEFIERFPCTVPAFDCPGIATHIGAMLTVSSVSGCIDYANKLSKRYNALGENMEGAAAAQVCAVYNIPFLEIRGISNPAGNRDKSYWDFTSAWKNAQQIAISALTYAMEKT